MIKKWVLGLALLLAACSEISPFVDSRREAGQVQSVGQSRPEKIAVCYHPLWHNEDEVMSLATEACARQNKKAVFADRAYFNCRLMTPNTAFYTCQ